MWAELLFMFGVVIFAVLAVFLLVLSTFVYFSIKELLNNFKNKE
nr:MAG TPA: hypothetical protein [Caudoviricetes sp.]